MDFVGKEWNKFGEFNKNNINSFLFSLDRRENYLVNLEEFTIIMIQILM